MFSVGKWAHTHLESVYTRIASGMMLTISLCTRSSQKKISHLSQAHAIAYINNAGQNYLKIIKKRREKYAAKKNEYRCTCHTANVWNKSSVDMEQLRH